MIRFHNYGVILFGCAVSLLLLASVVSSFAPSAAAAAARVATTTTNTHHHNLATASTTQLHAKIFVAGGTRGVGRCIVDQLVARGDDVVCMVRPQSADVMLESSALSAEQSGTVTVVEGDAFGRPKNECAAKKIPP